MKKIFCYDISSPKRLSKIAKELNKSGYRIQKSFFSCSFDNNNDELLARIEKLIDARNDKVAIYTICDKCLNNGYYIGCEASDFSEKDYFIL